MRFVPGIAAAGIGAMCLLAAGCSSGLPKPTAAQMAAAQRQRKAPSFSVEQIGRNSYGSAFRSAHIEGAGGSTAVFEYAPRLSGARDRDLARTLLIGAMAVPTVFSNPEQSQVQRVQATAVDPAAPSRRIVTFSISRQESTRVDWQHNADASHLARALHVDYIDPAYQSSLPH